MSKTSLILIVIVIVALAGFAALFFGQTILNNVQNYLAPTNQLPITTSPTKVEDQKPVEQVSSPVFDSTVTLSIAQEAVFPDGLDVVLTQISDSRCKPGVVCIWAGELSPVFNVMYGNEGSQSMQVTLGMARTKQSTKNGYTFTLNGVTETTATIVITKEGGALSQCYIGGCSSEICSAQQGVVSECVYKKEYVCYKTATCGRQTTGQCAWTQTPALLSCLNNK